MVLVDGLGFNIDSVKAPKNYRPPNPIITFVLNLLLIALFSTFVFVAVNLPAYYSILKYHINPRSVAIESPAMPSSDQDKPVIQMENDTLIISKIGVNVPVKWDVPPDEIMSSLEKGVVQIEGTGKPGEGKNIFITGHSSNYWWKEGDYNAIFALLPQLTAGDEIYAVRSGKINKYIVDETQEIDRKEVSKFIDSDGEKLTLMTCFPIGTNLRRLLVIASPSQ